MFYRLVSQLKPSCKKYANLGSIFLARSCAKSCTCDISCKSCTKNKAFLARYKVSCKDLARKNRKIIFLQDLIKILQEKVTFLQIFLTRFLQDFSYLARKASFLVQDLQDLARDLASLARKILTRFAYISCKTFFAG